MTGLTLPDALVTIAIGAGVVGLFRMAWRGFFADSASQKDFKELRDEFHRYKSVADLKIQSLEATDLALRLVDELQRRDMDAIDRRLSQVQGEWENYYGGSIRTLIDLQLRGHGKKGEPDGSSHK